MLKYNTTITYLKILIGNLTYQIFNSFVHHIARDSFVKTGTAEEAGMLLNS
jgi:hypothetical protein